MASNQTLRSVEQNTETRNKPTHSTDSVKVLNNGTFRERLQNSIL